jgi:hypothetical protein
MVTIGGVFVGLLIAVAWLFGTRIGELITRRKSSSKPAPGTPWQPLPGNVLELGATGYQIRFSPTGRGDDYRLFTPEGRPMGYCSEGNLEMLKTYAEQCAKERAQLVAQVAGWKP